MTIGRMKYDFWINHPESEDYLFNESQSTLPIMSWVYQKLVGIKLIPELEKITDKEKKDLKLEAKRIDPNYTTEKGMMICKAIYCFYYFSNT
jgi:hypothetical protein